MTRNLEIYIFRETGKLGPFTLEEIREKISDGEILKSDYCCHNGINEWISVSNLPLEKFNSNDTASHPSKHEIKNSNKVLDESDLWTKFCNSNIKVRYSIGCLGVLFYPISLLYLIYYCVKDLFKKNSLVKTKFASFAMLSCVFPFLIITPIIGIIFGIIGIRYAQFNPNKEGLKRSIFAIIVGLLFTVLISAGIFSKHIERDNIRNDITAGKGIIPNVISLTIKKNGIPSGQEITVEKISQDVIIGRAGGTTIEIPIDCTDIENRYSDLKRIHSVYSKYISNYNDEKLEFTKENPKLDSTQQMFLYASMVKEANNLLRSGMISIEKYNSLISNKSIINGPTFEPSYDTQKLLEKFEFLKSEFKKKYKREHYEVSNDLFKNLYILTGKEAESYGYIKMKETYNSYVSLSIDDLELYKEIRLHNNLPEIKDPKLRSTAAKTLINSMDENFYNQKITAMRSQGISENNIKAFFNGWNKAKEEIAK